MIIASTYGPKHAKAWHTNFPDQKPSRSPEQYTEEDFAAFKRLQDFSKTGSGYMAEQSTKPQTLGYSLSDSPVGLLAWIYEKLVAWSDAYTWEDDEGWFQRFAMIEENLDILTS